MCCCNPCAPFLCCLRTASGLMNALIGAFWLLFAIGGLSFAYTNYPVPFATACVIVPPAYFIYTHADSIRWAVGRFNTVIRWAVSRFNTVICRTHPPTRE